VTQNENGPETKSKGLVATRIAAIIGSLAAAFSASGQVASTQNPGSEPTELQEVIVTAEKKSERLLDVPIPLSVIDPGPLAENGELLIRDYYASVPGLTVSPNLQGAQMLSIRGITTGGFTNATVGVLVDDVPFGITNDSTPDLDPADLARIEVLRGPQGTLYGASTLGGLVKYVTLDPSTDGFSGRVQGGTSAVYNGDRPGYNIRASANIPLSQTFAIRVSGFNREDPGYIDSAVTGQNGINKATSSGARLAALWRPSEDFSLKVSGLYQKTSGDAYNDVDILPGLGSLQQNYERGAGFYGRKIEAYSATLSYKVGGFTLTSLSGYNSNRYDDTGDVSYLNDSNPAVIAIGTPHTIQFTNYGAYNFSQEFRLSTVIAQRVEWLLGAFYNHEDTPYHQEVEPENAATGQVLAPVLWYGNFPGWFNERALFTDLTFHVTDQFDVQIGGRESHLDTVSEPSYQIGNLFGGSTTVPSIGGRVDSTSNPFTYLLTPRFKVSSDLMVYARLASGYRPGGPNGVFGVPGVPPSVSPDKTQNYEIGTKGDFLNHSLSIDASLYYIHWKDIQVFLNTPLGFGYEGNAGEAKSQGIELSVESRPLRGLTITGWVAYDDASITQVPPGSTVYEYVGDRLPDSSRFSGNLSVQEEFPIQGSVTGFVGGAVSHVGDQASVFTGGPNAPAPRQTFPAYTKTDLRAGVKVQSWTVNLYVNNVADVRGVLNGGAGYSPPWAFQYITPRTVGLSVVKTF
jgi:iron complex outermembrane receptor protein